MGVGVRVPQCPPTTENKTMDKYRLERARALRDIADKLEREAFRKLPEKWKVGMRVRFLSTKEWAWNAGSEATVIKLSEDCKYRLGHEYQVFWTQPDSRNAIWWTTPEDVELVTDRLAESA